jgi:GTP-binding protein HflX
VDASAPDPAAQIDAVREVLGDIKAAEVPELLVFNKSDLAPGTAQALMDANPGSVAISAVNGEGVETFLRTLSDRLRALAVVYELIVPYDRGDILASVHREGEVVSIGDGAGDTGEAWLIRARLSDASAGRLSEFVSGTQSPASSAEGEA